MICPDSKPVSKIQFYYSLLVGRRLDGWKNHIRFQQRLLKRTAPSTPSMYLCMYVRMCVVVIRISSTPALEEPPSPFTGAESPFERPLPREWSSHNEAEARAKATPTIGEHQTNGKLPNCWPFPIVGGVSFEKGCKGSLRKGLGVEIRQT